MLDQWDPRRGLMTTAVTTAVVQTDGAIAVNARIVATAAAIALAAMTRVVVDLRTGVDIHVLVPRAAWRTIRRGGSGVLSASEIAAQGETSPSQKQKLRNGRLGSFPGNWMAFF